jgi:hypothetical protein
MLAKYVLATAKDVVFGDDIETKDRIGQYMHRGTVIGVMPRGAEIELIYANGSQFIAPNAPVRINEI